METALALQPLPLEQTRTVSEVIDQMKSMVLDSVNSEESKRAYGRGIECFLTWFQAGEPTTGFTKATVQQFRSFLLKEGKSSSTVNLYVTAVRRLALEATDNGLLAPDLASGISRVKGVKKEGVRTGNWLTLQQAEQLLNGPNVIGLKGKRDRAILAVLIGCGLRREEAALLTVEHIQQREGRWIIVDLEGKGRRVRSVPMPSWSKAAIDLWLEAAGFTSGNLFRSINKGGKISGHSMTAQAIFDVVKLHTEKIGVGIAPHDLRRTFAKLAHKGQAAIEQIQLSLGHASIQTTEKYLGIRQDLSDAPCDHLGLRFIAV